MGENGNGEALLLVTGGFGFVLFSGFQNAMYSVEEEGDPGGKLTAAESPSRSSSTDS